MPTEQEVRLHARLDGVEPYTRWMDGLRDPTTQDRIEERIARLRSGNFGDVRSVGGGVHELRIPIGAGFRIYFGRRGDSIVILLCAGNKKTQARDIRRAHLFWHDYWSRFDGR